MKFYKLLQQQRRWSVLACAATVGMLSLAGLLVVSPAVAQPKAEILPQGRVTEEVGVKPKPGVLLDVLPTGEVVFKGRVYPDVLSYHRSQAFRDSGARCGYELAEQRAASRGAPSESSRAAQQKTADCTSSITQIGSEYNPLLAASYTIPVYFHVIYKSDGTGNISDQRIYDQMAVLNEDYAGYFGAGIDSSIQFELAGITRTQNDAWFTDSSSDELAYKTALGIDQSKYLNIYTNDAGAGGILGYAYFPQGSAGGVYDGVVMLHSAIGGRNNGLLPPYDSGRTLVHEVGHYLGLYHTFQTIGTTCGNSYSSGDLIVDTVPQSSADYGCSAGSTCGVASAIENFMNYSDDSCMDRFTEEQTNRMICSLTSYRPAAFTVVAETQPAEPVFWSVVPGSGSASIYFGEGSGGSEATASYRASCTSSGGNASVADSATPSAAILDGQTTTSTIAVSEQGFVPAAGPSVPINITHTWIGDLNISLTSPSGTTITLKNASGDSTQNLVGTYPSTLTPAQSLSAFAGESATGIWTLRVSDLYSVDEGVLNSWGLQMDLTGSTPTVEAESASSPVTLTGMITGETYTCELTAQGVNNNSAAVAAGTVVPGAANVPGAPSISKIEAASESLIVSVSAGAGVVPTGYRVICGGQSVESGASPLSVPNLKDGTEYSCVAVAINGTTTGIPSAPLLATPETINGLPVWLLYEATK